MPALVAGTELAGLLFFLNPELPFSAPVVARAALYYAALAAAPSLAVHRLVARWRGVPVARLLPWSLTVVAAGGAIGDGVHASVYAFLLPEAINTQLIKAGLWLALAAVLLFYTALLHTLHHRRYGPRSRALVVIAVLGSVWAMLDRRTSYRASAVETPPVRVEAEAELPRLVVVAVPTATLDAVLPLARQGKLPFLARMIDAGASARLATLTPPRPAPLWTSWATGKLPFRHGVAGSHRYTAPLLGATTRLAIVPLAPAFPRWGLAGGRPVAVTAADRRAATVWEILAIARRPPAVIGFGDWLGGRELEVDREPPPPSIAGDELRRLGRQQLASLLARDRSRLATTRARLGAEGAASSIFVELAGLETAAVDTYGGFAAARFEARRAAVATDAAGAYEAYLAGLDAELEILWESLAPPRLLAVSSPYGIAAARGLLRPLLTSELELRGTLAGAPDGLLLLYGDGMRAGAAANEGRIVVLVPTLLYAAGLPLARDFDGRVLAELFEPAVLQQRALAFVPSYEPLVLGDR